MMNEVIWYGSITIACAVFVFAALIGLRYSMAALVGVHVKDELDQKDNHAFGLTIGGSVLALMLIMSGAIGGEAAGDLGLEILNIAAYTIAGVVFLKLSLLILDKLVLSDINLISEIKSGNAAASLVVTANMIATGIIVYSAINWSETDGIEGLIPVALVFVASQLPLAFVGYLRKAVYANRNMGKSWSANIGNKNSALAVRYVGHLIATALVVSAAGSMVVFTPTLLGSMFLTYILMSFGGAILLWLLFRLALPIVLSGINVSEEVDEQQNMGVAAIEAALLIGMAMAITGFVA